MLTKYEKSILREADRIKSELRENATRRVFRWEAASGSSLGKIARMFPSYSEHDDWYVLSEKIRGKTVFGRDHGTWTLYVLGTDDRFYSAKSSSGMPDLADPDTLALINGLVDSARTGEVPAGAGIYRNFKPLGA